MSTASVQLFRELLKERRKKMKPAIRKRTRNRRLQGNFLFPYAIQKRYTNWIKREIKKYTSYAISEIKIRLPSWSAELKRDSGFHKDAFSDEWQELFRRIRERGTYTEEQQAEIRAFLSIQADNISSFNRTQANNFYRQILGVDFFTVEIWERTVLQAWNSANVELIQNVSSSFFSSLNTIVSNGVLTGRPTEEIIRELRSRERYLSGARARLIARDQVGSLTGLLTERRNRDAGLTLYEWLTSADERVRPSHVAIGGKICKWSNSGVYSEDGVHFQSRTSAMIHKQPGEDIQCRCTSIPYLGELLNEIDQEIEGQ